MGMKIRPSTAACSLADAPVIPVLSVLQFGTLQNFQVHLVTQASTSHP